MQIAQIRKNEENETKIGRNKNQTNNALVVHSSCVRVNINQNGNAIFVLLLHVVRRCVSSFWKEFVYLADCMFVLLFSIPWDRFEFERSVSPPPTQMQVNSAFEPWERRRNGKIVQVKLCVPTHCEYIRNVTHIFLIYCFRFDEAK